MYVACMVYNFFCMTCVVNRVCVELWHKSHPIVKLKTSESRRSEF